MNWIYCNVCFRLPNKEKQILFSISSCGHFICQVCKLKDSDKKCRVCKNPCELVRLSNDLPSDIGKYFSDPVEELRKIIKVVDFQTSHSKKLLEHNSILTEKYNRLKYEYQKLQSINAMVMKENKILKIMIMNSQKKAQAPQGFFNSPAISNKIPQENFILSPANSRISIISPLNSKSGCSEFSSQQTSQASVKRFNMMSSSLSGIYKK